MMKSIRTSEVIRRLKRAGKLSLFSTNKKGSIGRKTITALVSQENYDAKNPWKQQPDPNGSQLTYYWNTETNETTQLGSPKPQHWVEVADPQGSEKTYWWNPETNAVTSLGEGKPNMFQATSVVTVVNTSSQQIRPFGIRGGLNAHQQHLPRPSFGRTMLTYATLGVGMTLGITLVRVIIGF